MALSEEDWAQIDALLLEPDAAVKPVAEWRQRFPHLTWIQCDASDVTETPFRVFEHFDIHLLDSAGHCAYVTEDPARATGIILARRRAG